MKTRSKSYGSLLIGSSLCLLVSCGDHSSKSPGPVTVEKVKKQEDQGIYRAVLRPLNTSVAGNLSGTVEIRIEGDEVVVESHVAGAPAGVKHFQNIMTKTVCPTDEQDSNKDTYLDMKEILPTTGSILVPLDSDLSEQLQGSDYGPISNSAGSYVYRRSTSLSLLLSDLHALDPDPVDHITKLPLEEELNLSGRVIVVHGAGPSEGLPDTVKGLGDLSAAEALPIACGQLVRVTDEDEVMGDEITFIATGTLEKNESRADNVRKEGSMTGETSTKAPAANDEVKSTVEGRKTGLTFVNFEEMSIIDGSFMATSDITPGTFI